MSYNKPALPQYQNLVIIGLQIVLNVGCNLPVQHGYLHFSITFGSQKLHFSITSGSRKLHFSIKFRATKLHFSIETTKQIGKKVRNNTNVAIIFILILDFFVSLRCLLD